jgi:hypothetical protein
MTRRILYVGLLTAKISERTLAIGESRGDAGLLEFHSTMFRVVWEHFTYGAER